MKAEYYNGNTSEKAIKLGWLLGLILTTAMPASDISSSIIGYWKQRQATDTALVLNIDDFKETIVQCIKTNGINGINHESGMRYAALHEPYLMTIIRHYWVIKQKQDQRAAHLLRLFEECVTQQKTPIGPRLIHDLTRVAQQLNLHEIIAMLQPTISDEEYAVAILQAQP